MYKSDWLKRLEASEARVKWNGGFVIGTIFGIALMLLINLAAYLIWANNFIEANVK